MAVGGAEAPGAGAANVVVADNTPPANAAPGNPSPANATGQGSAGSPGGPLPPLSTQPVRRTHGAQAAHLRAVVAPLQTARIATALIQLNEAQNKLVAAKRSGDAPTIAAAERGVQVAKHNLVKAIKQEAERLSRPSSFGACVARYLAISRTSFRAARTSFLRISSQRKLKTRCVEQCDRQAARPIWPCRPTCIGS